MKSLGWLSPHCPEDGRELPNVPANALLQYRSQGFMENSSHQTISMLFCNNDLKVLLESSNHQPLLLPTITRIKNLWHVVFDMIKKKHDDVLTIILRSTSLTDWAGSWMPSRTHGLSCRLRFIWLRFSKMSCEHCRSDIDIDIFRHILMWQAGQARQAAGSSRDPGVRHWHRHHRGAAKGLPHYNTQRLFLKIIIVGMSMVNHVQETHLIRNYFFSEAAVSICPPAQTQGNTFTFLFCITFFLH